jgi:hypothetical protein
MQINSDVVFILVMDEVKWNAVKGYASRHDLTEGQVLGLVAKEVDIPNYDPTLAVNFADAIVNYCNEN